MSRQNQLGFSFQSEEKESEVLNERTRRGAYGRASDPVKRCVERQSPKEETAREGRK